MSQEANYWDGATDFLGELWDGGKAYLNSETAKANADKAANENATLSQQARIDELRKQEAQAQQNNQTQKMMMFGLGGFALLIVLVLIFKK
ncbi:hypothetical protein RJD39_00685 [Vibrio scophthalmi]|uniref:hypothetical protein n=1 Tax=Vibrio scophthalmi TaxID=45658 RepID=UPI0038734A20